MEDSNGDAKEGEEKPARPQTYTKTEATKRYWEWEKPSSLGKNTPNDCPIPNGQP